MWSRALRRQLIPLGLVWLASHPGFASNRGGEAAREYPPDLVDVGMALSLSSKHRRAVVQELLGFAAGAADVSTEARHLGRMPLAVLSGGMRGRARYAPVWPELQAELARLSERATHVVADHTGHHVHLDDPDLVVRTIGEFVEQLRSGRAV